MKFEIRSRLADLLLFIKLFLTISVGTPLIEGFKLRDPITAIALRKGSGGGGGLSSGGVLGIIAAGVGGTFGFLFLLIIGGQIGGSSGIYGNLPTSNITAITGNIGKAVVTGSNFVVLIYLGAGVAIAAAMIFLALHVFQRGRG